MTDEERSMLESRSQCTLRSAGHSLDQSTTSRYSQSAPEERTDDYSDSFVSDATEVEAKPKRNLPKKLMKINRNKKNAARHSKSIQNPHNLDSVAHRVRSAKRLKINEQRNQVFELTQQLVELKEENTLLKRLQYRQQKALEKFEETEADLPQLLQSHSNEVRILKSLIRKLRLKNEKAERYLRDAGDELNRTRNKLNRYTKIVDEKDLLERDDLARQLDTAEMDRDEKDRKIKELEKHLAYMNKNHKHQVGIEMARYKETKRQVDELTQKLEKMEVQLQEKEKELDIKNIYSNRVIKAPHKLPLSYNGTPLPTPISPKFNLKETPRHRANFYGEKLRNELKQKKLKNMQNERKPCKQSSLESLNLKGTEDDHRAWEEDYKQLQEQREGLEERARREKEEEERRMKELREQMKQEAELLKQQRREKEEQEHAEQKKKEMKEEEKRVTEAERKRMENEEQEHQVKLERQKEAAAAAMKEERRQKDLLLSKLKDIDKRGTAHPFTACGSDSDSSTSKKSTYNFSKPVESLHQGKPTHENIVIPYLERKKAQSEDACQPVFGKPKRSAAPKDIPSRNLMDDLFGNSASIHQNHLSDSTGDTFITKKKSKLPWETENSISKHSALQSETMNTIFGGGNGLIDDRDDQDMENIKMLPRRPRQTSTIHSKPSVMAVESYEDDIEEVIL